MRRPDVLKSLTALSFAGLVLAVAACATSAPVEDDDLSGQAGGSGADEGNAPATSKLPPASNPPASDTPKDAGAPKDLGTPKDSGSTPADAGPPPNTGICDPSDPMNVLKLLIVGDNATACPCSATECCLQGADICLPN